MRRRDHIHQNTTPAGFLVTNRHLLPAGRVLDLAMGAGRNTVYLAKEGFTSEGIDISSEAIEKALTLAENEGVKITAIVADLENGYRLAPSAYDLIICFYYLHRPLIPEIRGALKPGGVVVYETYITDQAEWGLPKNPGPPFEARRTAEHVLRLPRPALPRGHYRT